MSPFNEPAQYASEPPRRQGPPPVSPFTICLTAAALFFAYYPWRKGNLGITDVYSFGALIPSVILHEISHGAIANFWGDPTAKRAGRLTLNPLRHIDPLGTILLPGVLILLNAPVFGYAKPVPVNTTHMTKNKAMMVGLIGPITNIVIALLFALAINGLATDANINGTMISILFIAGAVNVILAVFNLIPIPPLDGSSIIERFLPEKYMRGYDTFRQYSMIVLIFLSLGSGGLLNRIFDPAIDLWIRLLPFSVG